MGKPKARTVWKWCPGGGEELSFEGPDHNTGEEPTTFVRCSVCRRRYEALNRGCGLKAIVPKHKRRVKVKP